MAQKAYIEAAEQVRKCSVKNMELQQTIRQKDSMIIQLQTQLSIKKQSQLKNFQLQSLKKSSLSSTQKILPSKDQISITQINQMKTKYQQQKKKFTNINYGLQMEIQDQKTTIQSQQNQIKTLKKQNEQKNQIYKQYEEAKVKIKELKIINDNVQKENKILKQNIQNMINQIKNITQQNRINEERERERHKKFEEQFFKRAKKYQSYIKQKDKQLENMQKFKQNIVVMKRNTEILTQQYNRINDSNKNVKNYENQLKQLKSQVSKYISLNNHLRLKNGITFNQDPSRNVITKFQSNQRLRLSEQLKYIKSIAFSWCVLIQNELINISDNHQHKMSIQQNINQLIKIVKDD